MARRIGRTANGWRWAKRNPTVATMAATIVLVLIAGIAATSYWAKIASDRSLRATESLVNALASAHPSTVQVAVEAIVPFCEAALPLLRREFEATDGLRKLHLAYGLAQCGQIERTFLVEAVATAPEGECDNITSALAHDRDAALADIKREAAAATSRQDWKLKIRLAVVAMYLGDQSIAAEMLQAEPLATAEKQLVAESIPNWHDLPLDPNWTTIDDATKAVIADAHGVVADRFAFCLDMPWDTFLATIETLRPSGYRPTRVRPFVSREQLLVAAIWTRDGGRWRLDADSTADKMPPPEANAEKDGLVPADVAAYRGEGETTLYCVLWSIPTAHNEQRRIRVGMTMDEWEVTSAQMRQGGLPNQTTIQVWVSTDGTRRCTGIWSNQGAETVAVPAGAQPASGPDQLVWEDISVASAGKLPHPLDVLRQQLAAFTQLPPAQQETPDVRLSRAKAHYYLDQPQNALRDLDLLVSQTSPNVEALLYCVLCRAQLGEGEEAQQALARMSEFKGVWGDKAAIGQILMCARLGKVEEAKGGLDVLVFEHERDSWALYGAARAAAQLTRIVKNGDPEQIATWKHRSLELIRQAYAQEYMQEYSGNAALRERP